MIKVILLAPALVMAVGLGGCSRDQVVPPAPPGGVYRSASAGASFEQSVQVAGTLGEYIASFSLSNIFRSSSNPDVIFVAAGSEGVVRSTDDGKTWEVIKTPLALTRDVVELASGVLVASGSDAGGQGFVIRSLDAGLSWNSVFTIPVPIEEKSGFSIVGGQDQTPSVVLSLAVDPFNPDRLYAGSNLGTIFAGEQSAKVWRTVHDLTTPNFDLTGLSGVIGVKKLVPSPFVESELLVITDDQRLLRLREGAQQEEITVPSPRQEAGALFSVARDEEVFDVAFVSQFPEALLVGIQDGIAVSQDRGQTWVYPGVPLETRERFNSVVAQVSPTNPNRFLVAVNNVVYRSEDGGRNWNSFSLGLPNFKIISLSINPQNAARVLLITQPLQN